MKNGLVLFLVAFVALGASWCGLVFAPQQQLGGATLATVLNSTEIYPRQRTGDATLGAQSYRAHGCAACHTEQIRQDGVACEVSLTSLGSHPASDFKGFMQSLFLLKELKDYTNNLATNLKNWNGSLPFEFLTCTDKVLADDMVQRVNAAGVKAEIRIIGTGPDLSRGWGFRQSVAGDYLYDTPVQLGSLRAGPDLANIGVRAPDANWQLNHLFAPRSVAKDSTMPPFRYLFTVRKIGATPAPDALKLSAEFAPAAGFEVVPTTEARQLVAYLLSLKANAPLYEAPFTALMPTKP